MHRTELGGGLVIEQNSHLPAVGLCVTSNGDALRRRKKGDLCCDGK